MAVRNDFSSGEVLTAADLNDTFASKLPYSYGTATPTTSVDGFLWYDENDTPPTPKFWDGAAFQALTSGKILQVVRASDGTRRTTTSTSFVDGSLSVSITPSSTSNAVLIVYVGRVGPSSSYMTMQITDSSNNAMNGAEDFRYGITSGSIASYFSAVMFGYATPATTSSLTYKIRFKADSGHTAGLYNDLGTGQLYALEIAA